MAGLAAAPPTGAGSALARAHARGCAGVVGEERLDRGREEVAVRR